MDDIKDHPSYWFVKQVEDFRRDMPYPHSKHPLYDVPSMRFSPPRSSTTPRPMAAAPARPGLSIRTCQMASFKR